ncbi:MAG: orotidine 5'-phosphate decarboxylase, partial [Planctomycetes bacterium]|nr:orotidine 5'-phosphate decarboxylase [Planctomycetota bacterium]
MKPFGDRLADAVKYKKSVAVIGIDPNLEKLPPTLRELADSGPQGQSQALTLFGLGIIEAVQELVPAVKPNIAFFEQFGINGLIAYNAICRYAHTRGLIVIGDVKRGDIGSTA